MFGGIWDGEQSYHRGTGAGYWSSTVNTNIYALLLSIEPKVVYPAGNYHKYFAISVRYATDIWLVINTEEREAVELGI